MAKDEDPKHRIIGELAQARLELSGAGATVRGRIDVPSRISASLRRHSWGWISLAAILGWILSRLPGRKKIYIEGGDRRRIKAKETRDRKRDLAWLVWDGVWSLAKPLITAYLGRKLAQTAGISSSRKA
jgi:hypothetical protein